MDHASSPLSLIALLPPARISARIRRAHAACRRVPREELSPAGMWIEDHARFLLQEALRLREALKNAPRLPGSGGANDMGSGAGKIVIISRHLRRKFPARVAYITTPGFLDGPGARERCGLRGEGPVRVVTDLGVFGFDDETKRMKIISIHPGVDKQEIIDNTQFEILGMDQPIPITQERSEEIQRFLRRLDRHHEYIGK